MLALVDTSYKFLYINVGSPGCCHDSAIFEKSSLKRALLQSTLLQAHKKIISGVEVPLYIIGDSAFKLSPLLMKPYAYRREQTAAEKRFNYILSKSRRVVENAFGHLKARSVII